MAGSDDPTDPQSTLVGYLEGPAPTGVTGLNSVFAGRLAKFLDDNPNGVSIVSGFRTPEHQAQLLSGSLSKRVGPQAAAQWKQYIDDAGGDVVKAGEQARPWLQQLGITQWVAPPGYSNHQRGTAADLSYENPQSEAWSHANAGNYGLRYRMTHEGWHIEPADNVGGASPVRTASSTQTDDNPFLAGVKPVDPWTDLNTGVATRADGASLGGAAPTMSPDDVFKELTARAGANKTRPASTTPSTPTTTPEQAVAAAGPPAGPQAGAPPAGDASAAVGGGIIGGVPVIGDALRGGLVRTAAAARAYLPEALGGQPNTTYANEIAKVQAWDQATQQQHPIATATGNVVGAAAAMAPAMAAAPAAFGIEGATLAGRSIASALTGGALGGADAAVRSGGNLAEAAKGAGLGAVFGGAAPGAGQLVGAGVQKAYNAGANLLLDRASGISTPARNMLMGAIDADTPQAIRTSLDKLGPQGMIADAGPSTTGIAQGMALKPGAGKSELVQAIKDRAAGTNARLAEDVAAIGPAEDPQTVTETILATRKALDSQNYGAALANAPDVDVKSVVQKIDGMLQTAEGKQKAALSNLRDQLVEKPAQPAVPGGPTGLLDASGNPIISAGKPAAPEAYKSAAENLHNLKGEIDAVINYGAPGLGVEAGAVARQQGALKAVRGALNEALQTQVPGYAEASAASAALAKRAEAVERGTQVLSGGKTTPTPGRDAAAYNALSPGEQVAENKGLVAEVNRLLGTKANDLSALRSALQGEGGWNTAKLETRLGPNLTNRLVDAVSRESQFMGTYNAVVGNSQTAARNAALKAAEDAAPGAVDLTHMSATGMLLGGAKKMVLDPAINMLMATNHSARDAQVARILSAQGAQRDKYLNSLVNAARVNNVSIAPHAAAAGNLLLRASDGPYRRAR
jgi:hypothetical protein